ncbi:unnamed protein product [Scytosiphon promiscuus]
MDGLGRSNLIATVRRLKEEDVQVTLGSSPTPTFTVPALCAREHRGGESYLLKDAFPSGFCKLRGSCPTPTTAAKTPSNSKPRGIGSSSRRPWLRELFQESKEVGVSPWGASSCRRALNLTRVVFGATEVVNTVGSALVQYGPGFSIGPASHFLPRRRWSDRSDHRRPRTPASPTSTSHVTIDGSALRDRNSLLVERRAVERGSQWPHRPVYAPDWTAPQHVDVSEGHTRFRPLTNRAQSPGEPEPWPSVVEELTGRSSRPSTATAGLQSLSPTGVQCLTSEGREGSMGLNVSDEADEGQAYDRVFGLKEEITAAAIGTGGGATRQQTDTVCQSAQSPHHDDSDTPSDPCAVKDKNDRTPSVMSKIEVALDSPGAKVPKVRNQEERELDVRDEKSNGSLGTRVLDEDLLSDGVRVEEAWAIDNKDNPSVWSCCSAHILASVATNNSSAVFNSSVGEGSVEPLSAKRSFSTLDAERYRESLSRDANEILRSHLKSRNEPSSETNSIFSNSRQVVTSAATALLDDLLAARGQEHPPQFRLDPMERSPEMCYVRTRSDLVLAVVRKEKLLDCADDGSFRSLKTAARPVRIKADMDLADGLRVILASGVLRDDAIKGTSGQAQALEYFNPYAGTWETVRNESDWRVFLTAQAGPQGAGVVFQSTRAGASVVRADFLVAVTSTRPPVSLEMTRSSKSRAPSRYAWSNATRQPHAARRVLREKPLDWRYATAVTPGVLRSSKDSNGERNESQDTTNTQAMAEDVRRGVRDDFRQRLADLDGETRIAGPGPGAALWMTTSTRPHNFCPKATANSSPHRPRKDKVRRLVRHLEAGLMLKGQPGAGGLPLGGQKIDMPYTKELAKWSYDEILGIPRATATASA